MKKAMFMAGGALALMLPIAASAQQYYGNSGYGGASGYHDHDSYDQPRGDYAQSRYPPRAYREFRPLEAHITQEIRASARAGDIEPDDARDLMDRLRQIQAREMREQFHGWNLPDDDRESIRGQLETLDQQVDEIRDES